MILPLAFALDRKFPDGFYTGWDPRQLEPERLQRVSKGNFNFHDDLLIFQLHLDRWLRWGQVGKGVLNSWELLWLQGIMRHSSGYWPVMVEAVKSKTNWSVKGRPLQLPNSASTSSVSWQMASEEWTTMGSWEPFQIPESQWRSSDFRLAYWFPTLACSFKSTEFAAVTTCNCWAV